MKKTIVLLLAVMTTLAMTACGNRNGDNPANYSTIGEPKISAKVDGSRMVQVGGELYIDTGERMLLNFGHTLAHTIEQYYQYERESHGEAVGIGMYQLTKMSEKRGLTAKGCAEKIRKALDIYNLPTSCKLTVSELIKAISLDKKNLNGHLNLVLLKEIGDSYIYPTKIGFFENELNTFM